MYHAAHALLLPDMHMMTPGVAAALTPREHRPRRERPAREARRLRSPSLRLAPFRARRPA